MKYLQYLSSQTQNQAVNMNIDDHCFVYPEIRILGLSGIIKGKAPGKVPYLLKQK